MPFEVKGISGVFRCEVCGKLITSNPLVYKTCCMNKPVVLCSKECLSKWIAEWGKNQDQVFSKVSPRKASLRKIVL